MPYVMPTPGTISRPKMRPTQKSWRLELAAANEQYKWLLSDAARLDREAAEEMREAKILSLRAAGAHARGEHEDSTTWILASIDRRDRAYRLRGHASLRRDEAAEVAQPWTVVSRNGAIFLA